AYVFPRPRQPQRRQADLEGRAAVASVAVRGHAATVQLDDAAHDGQAQPQPGAVRDVRAPRPHERVEDLRQELGVDALAGVRYAQDGRRAFARGVDRDDAARLGVANAAPGQVSHV